jgi:hypothetical protein
MDPVTALGLACNILQLVEQAIEATKVCKELYEQGSLDESNKVEEYAEGISAANKELEATFVKQAITISVRATRVQKIANEASATAAELKKVLNQLKVSKNQIGAAFKTFLKTVIKKGTIDRLREKLERQDAALRSGILKEL